MALIDQLKQQNKISSGFARNSLNICNFKKKKTEICPKGQTIFCFLLIAKDQEDILLTL